MRYGLRGGVWANMDSSVNKTVISIGSGVSNIPVFSRKIIPDTNVSRLFKGDLVWFNSSGSVPDGEDNVPLFVPGEVVEYHPKGNVLILKCNDGDAGAQHTVENSSAFVRKRVGALRGDTGVGFNDMISMNDLTEHAILWNIKERYAAGEIYTYVGSILISVNPYKMFDIYGLPVVKKYEGKVLGALPPHLFAISSSAYTRMSKDALPQVIVISGESGSGKTEATKLIMGYLALVNKSPSNLITEQILEANPLLESFGNAKTGKNDNSSRFGKYLQVYFNVSSSQDRKNSALVSLPIITGCRITEYLLEKSRIVTHNEQERNYHVFYELLRGLSKEQKEKYGLLSAEKYFYLNQGGNCTIPGKHDAEDFQALLSAMQILGFNNEEINNIFKILASVLHLGNVYFHRKNLKHGVEGVEIGSDVEVQWIGHLLEINPDGIRKALTSKITEARMDKVTSPLSIDQSLDARDAIAKVLYSSLFSWLVNRINKIVYKGDNNTVCINILDIFGFEDFKENTFEQLLINYANECLQHMMNKHIFKLEQQEYQKEKIEWSVINFEDNFPVINLLTKKPVGVLHLLDDESNFPKGTDNSFLEKCHYNHALNEHYVRPRMNGNEFGIKHYAGVVAYNVEGFLEKNRDMVRSDVLKLLASSRCSMISRMFAHAKEPSNVFHFHGVNKKIPQSSNPRFITMKPRAPTVAARFHDNLTSLLDSMTKCSPWFVKCVKPNELKTCMKFDVKVVSTQLRYSGVIETIRIRKLGYPVRVSFKTFANRYKCLMSHQNFNITARDLTRNVLTSYGDKDYQLGATKVFLREVLEQKLDQARYDLHNNAAIIIQTCVRGYVARKRFNEVIRAVIKIQAFIRMTQARNTYHTVRVGVIKLQALIRMKREKNRYNALLKTVHTRLCVVTGVNHLEIPAELAFMMSKIDDQDHAVELIKINKSKDFTFNHVNIESYNFDKYVRVFFKSTFGMRREPILTPFLKDSPEYALTVFKLILRYMNDPNLTGKREVLLMNYIVHKGMQNSNLRDEILVQILNQTKNNDNKMNCDRGWVLLAACLSAFQPSDNLYNYLLHYSFNSQPYSNVIQVKLLQMNQVRGAVRSVPPFGLEYKCIKSKSQMYVEVQGVDVRIESWSTVGDVAREAGGFDFGGFTLEHHGTELPSYSFILDHINESFATAFPFKFQVPTLFNRQVVSHSKSKSLENLIGMGLSSSKLNERYHSFDQLDDKNSYFDHSDDDESIKVSANSRSGNPRFIKSSSKTQQRSLGSSVYGSSRMYIENNRSANESVYGVIKSSALSDTSEAPSLASHVRRVRVPSQASDVDQFLDDLFSPVLENLDDLSDARSLITSIKGGGDDNATSFLQNAFAQNLQIQQQLIAQNQALQALLQQTLGGEEQRIPVPPPLPPSPMQGHRPFIDPYGRAKTVRIGKWRWPPRHEDLDEFNAFKARVEESKKLDDDVGVWPIDEDECSSNESIGDNKFVGLIGGKKLARPFGGDVVGKLKLSNEMRMKLEQVTSVRISKSSGAPKIPAMQPDSKVVKKIDDSRKNLLEMKLRGNVIIPPPPPPPVNETHSKVHVDVHQERTRSNNVHTEYTEHCNNFLSSFKLKNCPKFLIRKEVFMPGEEATLNSKFGEVLKAQVVRDYKNGSPRILEHEKGDFDFNVNWKEIVEVAKSWEIYFFKLFKMQSSREVSYLGVNGKGLKLLSLLHNNVLQCTDFYTWLKMGSVSVPKRNELVIETDSSTNVYYTQEAESIKSLIVGFYNVNTKSVSKSAVRKLPKDNDVHIIPNHRFIDNNPVEPDHRSSEMRRDVIQSVPPPPPPPPPPPLPADKSSTPSPTNMYSESQSYHTHHRVSTVSPEPVERLYNKPLRNSSVDSSDQGSTYQDDGKHSLLQFAIKYFRQDKFNINSMHDQSTQSSWTWRDQIGLVKYSPKMIECSLLPMDDDMNRVALETYASLLKYIGDFNKNFDNKSVDVKNNTLADVEAVYTILRNCHNSAVIIRDEVYCQAMKQTTNNSSKSAQRAWRLFTILAAYFTCSEVLRPYLFKYLETNAYDKRRAFHGTALVCLQNLRKTFNYGGRRNVPSVEEITAITAGRNAKRQIFRLPGGTQRILNIKATTVVQDVIDELCGMLNINDPPEAEEFSVYCIVEGDTFTMPLQKEEYILDVTTELQKNQQTFYLIFCRSVWFFPMRLDSNLYIEVVFNQIAPDYLEGLLLTMPGQALTQNQVYDISKIAALLHRAADLSNPPTLKETKYLLPKPALAARDMRPNQWVSLVNNYWNEDNMAIESFTPMNAKATVLQILQSWDLFGSSFFSVKRLADPAPPEEYIMALNKNGVHFLDIITHETLNWWSYSEIISTRKVKNEDGILYLDMKTGNLMQTRITRFQTEHAHEISRLIRQYIHIQKYSSGGSKDNTAEYTD